MAAGAELVAGSTLGRLNASDVKQRGEEGKTSEIWPLKAGCVGEGEASWWR